MIEKLWRELHGIVQDWVVFHPALDPDELVDDLYDYIVETYGPPF